MLEEALVPLGVLGLLLFCILLYAWPLFACIAVYNLVAPSIEDLNARVALMVATMIAGITTTGLWISFLECGDERPRRCVTEEEWRKCMIRRARVYSGVDLEDREGDRK
jgi:hypothetical protein